MNFRRGQNREEPEMNLIPLIDVLMVILIFLMVTTSYAKYSELQINLPQAGGQASTDAPKPVTVAVDSTEHYMVNENRVAYNGVDSLTQAMKTAAGSQKEPQIVINADAKAPHQSVINVMEAARLAGYNKITFTTQSNAQ